MSLLDALDDEPGFADLAGLERIELPDGAWVDVLPGWASGSHRLFEELVDLVPWHAFEREMYGRTVAVPRLVKNYDDAEQFPHPRLTEAMTLLNAHYEASGAPARQRFRRAGLNLYRDGGDSVAWHHDSVGPTIDQDTMVAILSLGAPRILAVRPVGGATSHRFPLGGGDLLVMGGSAQRTHEHAIAKTSKAIGPRISVQFRPIWPGGGSRRSGFTERGDGTDAAASVPPDPR